MLSCHYAYRTNILRNIIGSVKDWLRMLTMEKKTIVVPHTNISVTFLLKNKMKNKISPSLESFIGILSIEVL